MGASIFLALDFLPLVLSQGSISVTTSLVTITAAPSTTPTEWLRTGTFYSKNTCPQGSENEYSATDLY
jgi:hypothetical protein